MRSLKLIAVLVPLLFAVGCAKRTAKKPAAADETAAAQTKPQQSNAEKKDSKGAKADDPNWVNDPRFQKDHTPALPAERRPTTANRAGASRRRASGTGPPAAGVQPMPGGGAPGAPGAMGVLQPEPVKPPAPAITPTAPKYSTVTEADMKEVWIFIENFSGANSGKIPSQVLIYQALIAAESKAAPLVKDGSIYLTDTKTRESIWAFETKALTSGGLVCSQNGVETLTAAELKKRLGK